MLRSSRLFKAMALFVVVSGTFLGSRLLFVRDHPVMRFNAKPGSICLYIDPPMRTNEMKPSIPTDDDYIERVCHNDYGGIKEWYVNFNVPRTFSFRTLGTYNVQFPNHGKTTTTFWKRVRSFIFNSDRNKQRIPKILHFIWTNEIIPTDFVDNLKLFRKIHPTWTMHFWTLKASRNFIEALEPQLLSTYDKRSLQPVDRADIFRYVVMYHIGGAYFDLDSHVLKPLDVLAENNECIVGPEPIENAVVLVHTRSLLANSGFMCTPRHAFFRHVIDQIPFYGALSPGPTFFTKSFNLFLGNQFESNSSSALDITVVPHDYFEFHVNKGVDIELRQKCERYKSHVYKYPTDCLHTNGKHPATCDELYMYTKILGGTEQEFEACLEWIAHGEENRKPDVNTKRYIAHAHYGTYRQLKALVYKNENNISLIVPDAILHL